MRGSLAVAAAALLWGLWPVWIRGGPGSLASATVAFLVGGFLGLPIALRAGRGRARGAADWAGLALLGLADVGNIWTYFIALDEGAVAPAVLSHYLAPVLIALAAPALLGEPRSPRTPLALVLALGGTAVLLFGGGVGVGLGARAATGFTFGAISALFYAALVLGSKRLAGRFADAELLVYHVLMSAAVMLVLLGGRLGPPALLLKPAVGGLLCTLLAGLLYYHGLRLIPAERAAVLTYLEPPSALLVAWIAFAEVPAPAAALGGALILAGGVLIIDGRP